MANSNDFYDKQFEMWNYVSKHDILQFLESAMIESEAVSIICAYLAKNENAMKSVREFVNEE